MCMGIKGILHCLSDFEFSLSRSCPNFGNSKSQSAQGLVSTVDDVILPCLALVAYRPYVVSYEVKRCHVEATGTSYNIN